MNIMNIEHISKIFGEKTISMMRPSVFRKVTRSVLWASMAPANPRCFE